MKAWKEAFRVAKVELSASILNIFLLFVFMFFWTVIMISGFSMYLENGFVGLDLFYLLLFTVAPYWAKPKSFQMQKVNDGQYASPAVGMLQQLPIQKEVIIKSRFIVSFVYTIPVQTIILIFLYVFSKEVQTLLSPSMYISFIIIWLSFSVYVGGIFPMSEAGDKKRSNLYIWGSMIGMIILLIALLTGNQLIFARGIVYYSIIFAQQWPVLSALISIILAIIGLRYWQVSMKKKMDEMDYF